eukprot:1794-Heterococcus_DN1.PRE.1
MAKDDLSGADIKAICTEAGLLALRERRMKVCMDDFVKAKEKALYRKKGNVPEACATACYIRKTPATLQHTTKIVSTRTGKHTQGIWDIRANREREIAATTTAAAAAA